jgi:hypothetical protein
VVLGDLCALAGNLLSPTAGQRPAGAGEKPLKRSTDAENQKTPCFIKSAKVAKVAKVAKAAKAATSILWLSRDKNDKNLGRCAHRQRSPHEIESDGVNKKTSVAKEQNGFAQKVICGRRLRRRLGSPPQVVVVRQRRFGVGNPSHKLFVQGQSNTVHLYSNRLRGQFQLQNWQLAAIGQVNRHAPHRGRLRTLDAQDGVIKSVL